MIYRPELDCLRFLAFLLVFLFHASGSAGGPAILATGAYGVDLFFLLSAYLITDLFLRERRAAGDIDVPAFYWRRILRIWPLYFAFIAVVVVAGRAVPQIQMPAAAAVALTFFYGNWYLTTHPFFSPAGILWSVSIEEQFYLCAPWIMRAFTGRRLLWVIAALIPLAAVARLLLLASGRGDAIWYSTIARLDPIAIGILAALLLRGNVPAFAMMLRGGVAVGGLLSLWLAAGPLHGQHPTGIVDGSLSYPVAALGALALFLALIGAPLAWRPVSYLGRISYGLYVFHLLALNVAKVGLLATLGTCPWWLRGAIALPVTAALAAASHRWLEAPFLRLKRGAQPAPISRRPIHKTPSLLHF
jgi:peptidoglycan/LPS O-acetylase OafA/YrhL